MRVRVTSTVGVQVPVRNVDEGVWHLSPRGSRRALRREQIGSEPWGLLDTLPSDADIKAFYPIAVGAFWDGTPRTVVYGA